MHNNLYEQFNCVAVLIKLYKLFLKYSSTTTKKKTKLKEITYVCLTLMIIDFRLKFKINQ